MRKFRVGNVARALGVCLQLQIFALSVASAQTNPPAPIAPAPSETPTAPPVQNQAPAAPPVSPSAPPTAPTSPSAPPTSAAPTQNPPASPPAQTPPTSAPPTSAAPTQTAPPTSAAPTQTPTPTEEEPVEDGVEDTIIEYDATEPGAETEEEISGAPSEGESAQPTAVEQPLEEGADRETGVEGRVVSRRPKKALPDAPVVAKGKDGKVRTTITDPQGYYKLFLPPGSYTLRSYYDLYQGARWDDIGVKRGKFSKVNFVLDGISEKEAGIEELEVAYLADTSTESAQLNIRKEAVNIQDAISMEEISRTGDGSAAGAARRVVGVTVDDEGRVVVRGLGSRYSKVLVNGVDVPSVDPDIPGIRLDLFPTDVVSNLSVVKTSRPDLPGDFAGGLVLIETSSFPKDFTFKVGTKLGYNSESTFKDRPDYNGGRRDWLGFDDGTRELPGAAKGRRLRVDDDFTQADIDNVARQFENIWNPSTRTALPAMGFDASFGDTIELKKGRKLGYMGAFLYDVDQRIRDGANRDYAFRKDGSVNIKQEDFDYKKGSLDVLWGTFGSGYFQFNQDNSINLVTLFSRTGGDTTLLKTGIDASQNNVGETSFDFLGASTFFNQLRGDHQNLGNSRVRLRWDSFVSTGKRDEPDRRRVEKLVDEDRITKADRFFSELNQLAYGVGSDLRFPLWQRAYATTGLRFQRLTRDLVNRRFEMNSATNQPLIGDPEVLFSDSGIGPISVMVERTRDNDSYEAFNNLIAGFAQLETPLGSKVKLLTGVRIENFHQVVESQSPFDSGIEAEKTDRTDLHILPSLNLSWSLGKEMFIRAAYGMTVARPAIRELAPYTYSDFVRGWTISGNPKLQNTSIHNAELRYEWYIGKSDLLAASAFYKYFDKPIEFVIFDANVKTAGYANAESAYLYGGEIELRLGLSHLSDKLKYFFLGGNVALMSSQTRISAKAKSAGQDTRRLYNQSNYVTNLSLRFDEHASGVTAALVYNVAGPRIVEVGGSAADITEPNVIERPVHYLDFVSAWKINNHFALNLKWKNMLLKEKKLKQGSAIVNRETIGTSVILGAEYNY